MMNQNGLLAELGGSPPQPTRSYLAKSVDDAIAQAREELGPEAMLLNTRRLTNEQGLPGGYEVVFAMPQPETPPAASTPQRPVPEDLAADLERLHSQMDEIRDLLMRSGKAQFGAVRMAPELAGVFDNLIASEVDPVLSKDIVDRLGEPRRAPARRDKAGYRGAASLSDPDTLEAFVLAELQRRVGIEPRLGQNDGSVVLIGPPGAGKTTTLAKLASFASGLAGMRPVRLVSLNSPAGNIPPGTANLRLQKIAEALGIAFIELPAAHQLPSLIAESRKKEFLLIDTPGYAATDRKAAEATAAALVGCPEVDAHLVVPGYMKPIDLRRCIQRYEIFRPSRLLVTKLDETHSFGSVFSEAARAGLSLSFLAHGPMIPRDIRPASPEDLLALAVERHPTRSANVA
jgi:flagellar biosynthesis protein FlhF